MSTAVELLRQILATPDDDQLRLVYADQLQAAGDPRGELVALDLELARARRPALLARRAALLAQHAAAWWPELPVERLDIRRGFVERVAAEPAKLAAATALFEREPIARVEVVGVGSGFDEAPWQGHCRHLAVRGALDRPGLLALTALPFAEQLESLDLGSSFLWQIPALGDAFPALRALALADNPFGERSGELAHWRGRAHLEHLDLRRCRLDATTLLAILVGMPRLQTLRLSGNPLGPDGAIALGRRLVELPALRYLELIGTGIDSTGVRALLAQLPGVQLVTEAPRRIALDLVSTTLELVHEAGPRWHVEHEGVRRHIELQHSVQYDGGRPPRVTHGGSGLSAEIDSLARALGEGAVRQLQGKRAVIELGSSIGAVYNTSVWSSEKASIAVTKSAIEITFSEYIDTSS